MDEKSLQRQREYRQRTGNKVTKKYERTKSGKLMRSYRNMQSRVYGIQWKKSHLYAGKDLLSKDEFYEWAMSCDDFHKLFQAWVDSEYDRKLSPSVDRIDSSCGYTIDNMRWLTHSENSKRGAISRYSSVKV